MTLYDDYNPTHPLDLPMNRMYRSQKGPFPGRVCQFAGITPGKTREGKTDDVFNLWLSDLVTGELECYQTSREELREFHRVMPDGLGNKERIALEGRAKLYAQMCVEFARLSQDPNAGKGPEHFSAVDDF
jgi:hypothetical protein